MGSSRRHLPHVEREDSTFFLSFSRRRDVDADLSTPTVARIIVDALHFFDGERYLLYDYTVMPDHVHVILRPLTENPKGKLSAIMQSIKGYTAHQINEILGRKGAFWEEESHDRIINGWTEYKKTARYIWNNPRVCGLVDDAGDWPWSGHGSGE